MAGTLKRRRGLYMQTGSIPRELAIEHNKVITDLELVRKQISEFVGSKTFDAASILDGAAEATTVTVTGAALGDFVTGVSLGVDLAGITVTAYVSAANTVTVRLQNESGGAVDLASTTLRVMVASHSLAAAASDLTAAQLGDSDGTAYTA